MKEGSIVAINYTGKVVVSGEVFESTFEKKAVEAGIFDEKQKYGPLVAVVGEGDVLPGLDTALREMKQGEQKEVLVKPADGWGERKPANIRVVPLQQFKQKKVMPFPGMAVDINGMQGKVQSVSGGRVRVDFNHPLAGKELLYDLKIEREITEPKEQIEALYRKYFFMVPDAEKKLLIEKDSVQITLSPRWSANLEPLKQLFSGISTKYIKGIETVRFVEEFKQEKQAGKEAAESAEKAPATEKEKGAETAGKAPAAKKAAAEKGISGKKAEKAKIVKKGQK